MLQMGEEMYCTLRQNKKLNKYSKEKRLIVLGNSRMRFMLMNFGNILPAFCALGLL